MSDTPRRLEPIPFAPPPVPKPPKGRPGQLALIPVDRLVVDERYQRGIAKGGRANVRRILEAFDWTKFSPVIVAARDDGLYAIIDGQHRATAALMHPAVHEVPCMVLDVTPEQAAASFAAINGQVTALLPTQIYAARLSAGEPSALVLQGALDEAGVTVLRYKFPGDPYQVGETLAIGALQDCLKRYGRTVLIAALRAVTRSFDGNPGLLRAPIIKALCKVLSEEPDWVQAGERLWEAMDEAGLADIETDAARTARELGISRGAAIETKMRTTISAGLAAQREAMEA